MKKINLIMLATLAVCMVACKGKDGSEKKTDSSPQVITVVKEISGPMGEFFEIVPKEYTVNEEEGTVYIEIKRIKDGMPEPWKKGMKEAMGFDGDYTFDIIPEYRDNNGSVIGKSHQQHNLSGPDTQELAGLSVGESVSISFYVEDGVRQLKFSSSFEVFDNSSSENSSMDDETENDETENNETDVDKSKISSSKSENWDSVLDSYERYVDKYIAIMKKAQSGDASAMSEYPSLMQEAQEYGDKLQNAKGSLSASQMARYQRITNKMLKAAQ